MSNYPIHSIGVIYGLCPDFQWEQSINFVVPGVYEKGSKQNCNSWTSWFNAFLDISRCKGSKWNKNVDILYWSWTENQPEGFCKIKDHLHKLKPKPEMLHHRMSTNCLVSKLKFCKRLNHSYLN